MRLALVAGLAIVFGSTAIGQVPFGDDLEAGQAKAAKDKKLVLLYLAGKDSEDCQKINAEFAANRKLSEKLGRKYVTVRLMADGPSSKGTFKRFDAKNLPTFVVFDSDGRVLDRQAALERRADSRPGSTD